MVGGILVKNVLHMICRYRLQYSGEMSAYVQICILGNNQIFRERVLVCLGYNFMAASRTSKMGSWMYRLGIQRSCLCGDLSERKS